MMAARLRNALTDLEIRRAFEEELLYGEATDTIAGLLESLGLSQRELARRLGVSEGRVSQILSGSENLTLRTLAAVGWALGIRFELAPTAMAERDGTPAANDPAPPSWLERIAGRKTSGREWVPFREQAREGRSPFDLWPQQWRTAAREWAELHSGGPIADLLEPFLDALERSEASREPTDVQG